MLVSTGVSVHVLLHKESPRSAAGWVGLVWLSPGLGLVAYVLLGWNRVQRKATRLRAEARPPARHGGAPADLDDGAGIATLRPLQRAVGRLVGTPLVGGTEVRLLRGGEEALPAMLEAIGEAQHSVALMTFIFDGDPWGQRFVDALAAARGRGVEVRVLVDGVGALFSWPRSALPALRRAGVPFDRFLWSWNPLRMALLNLRNHRKVLVVDGRVGFTGGMNIRGSFVQEAPGERLAEDDLHVRVDGPLVASLLDLFATDWAFETGERLEGERWYPPLVPAGDLAGRVIPDGPDEDHDKAQTVLMDAVACAQQRVVVVTPYFLPEEGLREGLEAAARRGVQVDVVVPWPSNHPSVDRALRAELIPLLEAGVRVWGQPRPFDHTKLLVVDGAWSCVGSANWDPRSLRLNFEMLLEVHGPRLAAELEALAEAKRRRSEPFTVEGLRDLGLATRVIDRVAWLFKPYL
ncbi:MAG: cardiolipin synthase [Alphaproteobacteria bacterium]|nr:cardiolipin synthase [Alphaproteobacteria bacterium]